jgi:hypothetical protein
LTPLADDEQRAKYKASWYQRNKARCKEVQRLYKEANPEKVKAKNKRWHRSTRYGITDAEYQVFMKQQRHRCAVCRVKFNADVAAERAHTDHCHKTGKVRGILCHRCNVGLGHFGDNVKRMLAAVAYLQRGEKR